MTKKLLTLGIIALSIFAIMSCSKDDDITPTVNSTETIQQIATDLEGYKVAFGDTKKIYMMNPDGSNVEELTDASPISGYVSWSPDARYVYYASAN